jgi:hypothetical protein
MPVQMTLAEKVLATLRAGDCYPLQDGAALPPQADTERDLSEFELDLGDWKMTYGIAVGLARTEEPCEPIQSVAERAREAAMAAFDEQHNGEFAGRPLASELVEAVLRAHQQGDETALDTTLVRLGNSLGWPVAAEGVA